jgi:hypothetical protein
MKTCTYCGRENSDEALRCSECATELIDEPTANAAATATPWDRIAVLNTEAEAERLELELTNRQIPHAMITYADSALDGIYQLGRGWGLVEAPVDCRTSVLDVLHDIRESAAENEKPADG